MRSPADMEVLAVDVTKASSSQFSGCTIEFANPSTTQLGCRELFEPGIQIAAQSDSNDGPAAPSTRRVADDNKYIVTKHVTGVVVCVGRAHHLALTLRHNIKQTDEFIVVTTSKDVQTQQVALALPGVRLVVSDRCNDDHHAFNKGRMINDALRAADRLDWVLLTDADVLINPSLKQWMGHHAINPGVLYGTRRIHVREEMIPKLTLEQLQQPTTGFDSEPNGYFQLFNRRARSIRDRWPTIMSESFCSAGGVDSWFLNQFPIDKQWIVPELAATHIHHGAYIGDGWNGMGERQGPMWRQYALLRLGALAHIGVQPRAPYWLRMTDTLRGNVWEGEIKPGATAPPNVLRPDGIGGLIFLDRPIGRTTLHLAWWDDGANSKPPVGLQSSHAICNHPPGAGVYVKA